MPGGMQINQQLLSRRRRPSAFQDQSLQEMYLSRRGELPVSLGMIGGLQACDDGALMTASMLPGATSLQHGILAAFSGTAASILFTNTGVAGDPLAKTCFPRYIRALVATVPTSATAAMFASVLDPANRTPTNIALVGAPATATAYKPTPVCTNMAVGSPQIFGQPYFPLSTAGGVPPAVPAAGPNARTIVGNGQLRAQIPVALDEFVISFGHVDWPTGQLQTGASAGVSRVTFPHEAVGVDPGQWLLIHLWFPGNVTAGIAFSGLDMGWLEG